tara:strand:+ start:2343 stop:3218 length:876 start_codon:yes stop_codon:yes gene_type:complete
MDTCSYFIEDKALFGSYPNSANVYNELVDCGVKYFIDLTTNKEKLNLNLYKRDNYISYEIKDRYIPQNIYNFVIFIHKLSKIIKSLKDDEKIYIHCKGGHGRCGIIVSCLLCYIFNHTSTKALELTNMYHNNRKVMNEKWRQIGSPQTDKQKEFVHRLFKPIYLDKIHIRNTYYPLHNMFNCGIKYDSNYYKNVNVCYYSLKDKKIFKSLQNCKNFYKFKQIIEDVCENNIEGNERNVLKNIIRNKYNSNNDVKEIMKRTLIKPIKYTEDNIDIGDILEEIREEEYLNKKI